MSPRIALLCLLAAAPAGPAAAQGPGQPLGAAEFEAYVTGKTLVYALDGIPYGIEEYRRGRNVRWSFLDGECKTGEWYAEDQRICFAYDDGSGPRCWTFYRSGGGLRADFAGDDSGLALYETQTTAEPLVCAGPDVGV